MDFSVIDLINRIKSITPLKSLEAIGLPSNVISNWKARNTIPKSDDLYKIAKLLDVSMEWLLTGETTLDTKAEIVPDEKELLMNYRQLTEEQQRMIRLTTSSLLFDNIKKK